MPTPQLQLEVGSYYGKYFLLKKLAAGGMGEIFLAKQQGPAGFEKILVVKKVLPHLTENKEFVELFLSEARLAARMNHRNVVQLFELGEHQGSYFIAMEYVSGRTLRDLIDGVAKKKEKLPPEVCRSIAEQICDGASYAHNLTDVSGRSLNIIHRDLNPQNVLLSYTGDVKIIDFGIAKSEMSTVKTEAGMIKGKFVYMSPEQSLAKKLDKRSDIFAIGITLYEMLTGTNPFHKSNIVLTLEAVQRYDPPPPSEYDAAYAPFDPIIAKALVKDRDRRYLDAAEMLDDLRRIVVPRSPERLSQLMARLFRQQLEEEQRLLLDTDGGRAAPGGSARPSAARTPSRPAPTPVAKPELDGGTLILNPTAAPALGRSRDEEADDTARGGARAGEAAGRRSPVAGGRVGHAARCGRAAPLRGGRRAGRHGHAPARAAVAHAAPAQGPALDGHHARRSRGDRAGAPPGGRREDGVPRDRSRAARAQACAPAGQRRRHEHPHAGGGAGRRAGCDGQAAAVAAAGGAHADAPAGAGGRGPEAQRQDPVDRPGRGRAVRAGGHRGAARLAALGRARRPASAPRHRRHLRGAEGRSHPRGSGPGGRAQAPRRRAARAEETRAQGRPRREDRAGAAQDRRRQALRHAHRQPAGRRADHLRGLRAAAADRRLQPAGHGRQRRRRGWRLVDGIQGPAGVRALR